MTTIEKLRAFACELAGEAWDLAGARFTFTIPVAGEAGGRCGGEPGGGGERARVLPRPMRHTSLSWTTIRRI